MVSDVFEIGGDLPLVVLTCGDNVELRFNVFPTGRVGFIVWLCKSCVDGR